jgi:predicted AAA+ superfamily ATPase
MREKARISQVTPRTLASKLRALAGYYPMVAVTGPRQSGKTTLCRAVFPDRPYVSLEALDVREFARDDPRGFLAEYRGGVIIDEVQQLPKLLSFLQTAVDQRPDPGRFVLTGSQHFGLSDSIAQSLAGRCGLLVLLPPSLDELRAFPSAPSGLYELLWQGAYPRIYDRGIPAHQ